MTASSTGTLTVRSVAGSVVGKTAITVSPAKLVTSNKYKYKVQAAQFESLPSLGDDLSSWTTWNGTSEITATDGYYIAVAETESDFTCEKVAQAKVVSLLATSTAGVYSAGVWSNGGVNYTLTQNAGNVVKVGGTIDKRTIDPAFGFDGAGNYLVFKIKNDNIASAASLPSGNIVTVTGATVTNTYSKDAFETDGSLIVAINIPTKAVNPTVKIKWAAGVERTYTYDVSDVTLGN